jgi:LysM repeat protein
MQQDLNMTHLTFMTNMTNYKRPMQKVRKNILFFLLLATVTSHAQDADVIKNYINTYKDIAIKEMQRTGVPASITLAQGIHESGAGMSKLTLVSNNHFGIKCKSDWSGESVKHDDDAKGECFRKYPSAEDSYIDHSNFLMSSPRYTYLFSIDPSDYAGWANGLKEAGYATNPKYPQVLIKLIEDYQLQDYTLIAMGKQPGKNGTGTVEAGPPAEIVPVASHHAIPSGMSIPVVEPAQPVYPDGEFKINETKVVYVKKGTSFLSIAQQYKIDLAKLFEVNELTETEASDKDQLIYLQRKRKTGNNKFHIVQRGETLHDIAQFEGIRMESLLELNLLEEDMQPAIGEQLSLQGKSSRTPMLILKENYSISPVIKNRNTN